MNSTHSLPTLDTRLSDHYFASPSPEERELVITMWTSLQQDTPAMLARLGAWPSSGDPSELRAELHRMRGYISAYGLERCAGFLKTWQDDPQAIASAARHSRQALNAFNKGSSLMKARYAWLSALPL